MRERVVGLSFISRTIGAWGGAFSLAVAFVALLALLAGCANDPVVTLPDWDLVTPDGAVHPIHMPVHIDGLLPHADVTYELRASPPPPGGDARDRTLTLALPLLHARSQLSDRRARGR